jgi:Predicted ATPases involved in biogenesis of archaeal flagella
MSNSLNVIIGDRDTGKSTYLFREYKKALENGKKILIIDSATEHVEKSLLIKIQTKTKEYLNISQCDKKDIIYPLIRENMYPSHLVGLNSEVILCDASYYLEKGYDYPTGEQRELCRRIYKRYAMQVVSVFLGVVDVIIFDEIELIPESRDILERIKAEDKELYMALHKDDGLAGLQYLFEIERI